MMRGKERTVSEMIALTGLGKSTLSAHLAQLGRDGLLDYREDPNDRRCKRYYLTSRHVGTAGPSRDRPSMVDPMVDLPLDQNGGLQRVLLRSLIAELACCGLDLEPVIRETGKRVGEVLGRDLPAVDLEEWAHQAVGIWKQNDLGRLVVVQGDPLRLQVEGCRLCCRGDAQVVRLCQVTAGLLEGMACESLGSLVEVRQAAGDPPARADGDAGRNGGDGGSDGFSTCTCIFEVQVAAQPPID